MPLKAEPLAADPLINGDCHYCRAVFVLKRSLVYHDRDGNPHCSFSCLERTLEGRKRLLLSPVISSHGGL